MRLKLIHHKQNSNIIQYNIVFFIKYQKQDSKGKKTAFDGRSWMQFLKTQPDRPTSKRFSVILTLTL